VAPSTAAELLDAMQVCPAGDSSKVEDLFQQLIARCDPDEIQTALSGRIANLEGPFGEVVLRIIEAFGTPELYDELARSVDRQPDLPPDRAWEALSLLAGAGLVDGFPDREGRYEELEELLGDSESALQQFAEQIEHDPDGLWLALESLDSMPSPDRAAVLADLARQRPGPRVAQLFRLFIHSDDPSTRGAALAALRSISPEFSLPSWAQLADAHPDPAIVALARQALSQSAATTTALPRAAASGPVLLGSIVTSLDAAGRGLILLAADDGPERVTAVFECDVQEGIRDVFGQIGLVAGDSLRQQVAGAPGREVVEQVHELALGLLAGTLTLPTTASPTALRYWLERTAGSCFRPGPFFEPNRVRGQSAIQESSPEDAARRVMEACAWWIDESPLAADLAEERILRGEPHPPDPERDSGMYRYLFERRIKDRLELDRRMLLWMSAFWNASGRVELARDARSLALDLMDAQNAVPGHPFIRELSTRSLLAAQARLMGGVDLRDPSRTADPPPAIPR
jgi:hypothetical protein